MLLQAGKIVEKRWKSSRVWWKIPAAVIGGIFLLFLLVGGTLYLLLRAFVKGSKRNKDLYIPKVGTSFYMPNRRRRGG